MTPSRRYDPPRLWATDPNDEPRPFDRKRNTEVLPYLEAYARDVKSCSVCARCPDWTRIEINSPPPCDVGAHLLDKWNRAAATLVHGGGRDTSEVAS